VIPNTEPNAVDEAGASGVVNYPSDQVS
jgi:hypothetical protein